MFLLEIPFSQFLLKNSDEYFCKKNQDLIARLFAKQMRRKKWPK